MNLDKNIERYFTKCLENTKKTVYDMFEWKTIDVLMRSQATGKVIVDMKNLEFPKDYSQGACDIIASKYFRKTGIDSEKVGETSMRQVTHRMVHFWVSSMIDAKMIDEEQGKIVYDEIAYMILNQMMAPNSPQWFNTGLNIAYGIQGNQQGHYYYDENKKTVIKSKDAYTRTQGSACFIISVLDSLVGEKSLTDQLATETLLFKYGSGVGSNWSNIRGKDEALSGGGKSSGLLSFLKVSDRNAGAIKSGGTTRRAAKLNVLDMDHPEIMDFIRWKSIEEDKVVALGKMGYDTHFEGIAYETVSGQNANNSVRIKDDFMNKLKEKDGKWSIKGRVDKRLDTELDVDYLWDEVAKAAWRCGDPGVQYDDTINAWHTCPYGEDGLKEQKNRINASNPCVEYMFLDDTACNLASINIAKFYKNGMIDIKGYLKAIMYSQMLLESTIHWGQFPTKDIARRSYLFRTTGLGLTNLGYLFMTMGLPYDSNQARTIAATLTSLMTGYSYYTSSMMAEKLGAFSCYETNKESMLKVIKNHAIVAGIKDEFKELNIKPQLIDHTTLERMGLKEISEKLIEIWNLTINNGEKFGFRNAQVTVLAPTGTIAFAMDCATTSSEPFFGHMVYKKLVGGGTMEIENPAISTALEKLGYNKKEIKEILKYVKENKEIENAPYLKEEHIAVFDTANPCGMTGVRFISPMGHVKMMGALAPNVSGAISKTVNMPNESTVEDIKEVYRNAHKLGIKAIALFRDGCKSSQPLNSLKDSEKINSTEYENMSYQELLNELSKKEDKINSSIPVRVKPKGIRTARVHEADINGLKLYITVSHYENGDICEVYISSGKQGSLTKGLLDSLSTTISEMLQFGITAENIAAMYRGQKYEPSGFVQGHPNIKYVDSISDLISKIIDIELGNYSNCQVKPEKETKKASVSSMNLEDEVKPINKSKYSYKDYVFGITCSTCQSDKMVKNGTCYVCVECGTTTGCS